MSAALLAALAVPACAQAAPTPKVPAPPPTVTVTGDANAGEPGITVDEDGTAYIAWRIAVSGAPDQAGFCRLPRGAKACASTQTFSFPDQKEGFDSVRVLLLEPKHPVIDLYRCCNEANYAIESTDGGVTFSAPKMIGTSTAASASIGPGPRAVGSEYGAKYQAMSLDSPAPSTTFADLADNSTAFDGSHIFYAGGSGLVDATTPIAAFSDLRNTFYRVFDPTKGPDYNSSANWKPAQSIPGEYAPDLKSGIAGTLLLTEKDPTTGRHVLNVRRLNQATATFGPPTTITKPGIPNFATLGVDSGGGATVAYTDNTNDNTLMYVQAADGKTWGQPVAINGGDHAGSTYDPQVATAPDHGGFVVYDANDQGPIKVAVIRPAGAAGEGGPGNTPGCTTTVSIKSGITAQVSGGGCFKKDGSVYSTSANVRVNGIDFVTGTGGDSRLARAAANGTVQVDADKDTVKSTGDTQEKIGAVVLSKDPVSWDLDQPTKLKNLDKFDIKLFGFPIVGEADVKFDKGTVTVHANLGLPKPFDDVTGVVDLHGTQATGLKLDGLVIDVKKAEIGALGVRDVHVAFTGGLTTFEGKATFLLPPGGSELPVGFGFADGKFKHAEVDPYYTGPPLPLHVYPPTVDLTGIGFHVGTDGGFHLSGDVQLKAAALLQIDGSLYFGLPEDKDYAEVKVSGKASIFDFGLANAFAYFNTDGLFKFGGAFSVGNSVVGVNGSVAGGIDIPKGSFYASGDANVCVLACVGTSAIVSSIGIAACADIEFTSAGFGYKWGKGADFYLKGCDIDDYKPSGLRSLRQAGTTGSVTLKPGMPEAGIRVTGSGGLPAISVTTADGKVVSSTVADLTRPAIVPGAILVPDPKTNTVQVLLGKPAGGQVKVTSIGGAPVAKVESADGLAPTVTKGSLSGAGRSRTLAYSVTGLAGGRTVTFSERSKAGLVHVIGTAKGAKGTLPFSLQDGAGGKRTIVAVVAGSDGLPLTQTTIASYTAPAPTVPARVTGLRIRRAGGKATVTWSKAAGATHYLVEVKLTDGRQLQLDQKGRRVVVPSIEKTDKVVASVRGLSGLGRRGKAAAKTLKAGKTQA